jgi:hypothetical protein
VFVTGILLLQAILSKSEEKVGEMGKVAGRENGDHVVSIGRRRKMKPPP